MPLSSISAADMSGEKWDRFIRYDLCIADYDSLSDSEKALCEFIFDTEQSSPDTVICERARRTLAGDTDLGDRLTVDELPDCYGVWDESSEYRLGSEWYTHCVPDIMHLDGFDAYNEYWTDDSGKTYISYTGKNTGTLIASFKVVATGLNAEEADAVMSDHMETSSFEVQKDGTYNVTYEIAPAKVPDDRMLDVDGDTYYIQDDNSAVLVGSRYAAGRKNADKVTVPAEADGHKVTAVSSGAFAMCTAKEIVLPDTIESIGGNAFKACFELEKINIPTSLKYMGHSAFADCEKLKTIEFDCPVLDLPFKAFDGCTKLESVRLNVRSIGELAFNECTMLSEVTFGDKLEKISSQAFAASGNITELELPDSLRYIGQEAFADTAIEEIKIPRNVQLIGVLPRARGEEAYSALTPPPAYIPLNEEPVCAFPDDCTIVGYRGSEAQRYAEDWGLKFVCLDASEYIAGDANLDGEATAADAVAVLQHIGNRDKYALEPQGLINADVDGVAGVTPNDALVLQKWALER